MLLLFRLIFWEIAWHEIRSGFINNVLYPSSFKKLFLDWKINSNKFIRPFLYKSIYNQKKKVWGVERKPFCYRSSLTLYSTNKWLLSFNQASIIIFIVFHIFTDLLSKIAINQTFCVKEQEGVKVKQCQNML